MSATITAVTKIGGASWRYTYTGTAPFRRYSPDALVDSSETTDTTVVLAWDLPLERVDADEAPVLYVIDSTQAETDVPLLLHPARAYLQWRVDDDTAMNIIERYYDSAWVQMGKLTHTQRRLGYAAHLTIPIADGVTEQWRVRSFDQLGYEGNVLPFEVTVARPRSAPKTEWAYAGGTLTVSARAV